MTSETPDPYQPPSQNETGEHGASQMFESSQTSRHDHHFGSMFFSAFVGSLPLFVFVLLLNIWWDGYGILEYSKPMFEFVFINALASAVIVAVLYSVKFRSNAAALGLGCLWPFLLIFGLVLFSASRGYR
jgi:hypothetical protein